MTDPQDPTRLIHDPSVDEGLRQTLRQAASHVPPIDTAAGLARLEGAIASGGAAGGAAGGLSGGALAAGAVAVALIGGGIWYASQASQPAVTEPETVSAIEAPIVQAPVPQVPVAEAPVAEAPSAEAPSAEVPVAEVPVAEVPVAEVPSREAAVAQRDARETGRGTGDTIEPAATRVREEPARDARLQQPAPLDESALAREMARIAEARRALDSDPARALALVEESRREMPRSVLAQERDAIRVLALAALGREREAAPLAQRFLEAHPTSPFAERIRRAIATP